MTTLSKLVNDYLFNSYSEECVTLYEKWFNEYPDYNLQAEIMKQNGAVKYFEDEARKVFKEFIFDLFNKWDKVKVYNFWDKVNLKERVNEINVKDFFEDLKCCFKWFKNEFDITLNIAIISEDKIWNVLAFWFIHEGNTRNEIEDTFVRDFTKRVCDVVNGKIANHSIG